MKAEGEGGLALNKQPDNNIIYCERLNQFSSSYGQEEQALCTLCNSSRGIRLNGDNWKRDILMTDLEQITFTRAYYTLRSIFIDLPFAFALTGNNMCFVSVRLKVRHYN